MRRIVVTCILLLVPIVAGLCQGQPVGLRGDDPLFGTWVNQQADKEGTGRLGFGKSILLPDGHGFDYYRIADNTPAYENWVVVEKSWVDDQGRMWYRMKTVTMRYPGKGSKTEGFWLTRISADSSTIEGVWAESFYPDDVTPTGPGYGIQYRR